MEGKWYRYLNIVAAILIFTGGTGMNIGNPTPGRRYAYMACLIAGIGSLAILIFMKSRERAEDNSK